MLKVIYKLFAGNLFTTTPRVCPVPVKG